MRKKLAGAFGVLAALCCIAWITNMDASQSVVHRKQCFIISDNLPRREATVVAGRNGVVLNRTLQAGATSYATVTGTSVRNPPYPARLRVRLDETVNNEDTNALTLTCNVSIVGSDGFGRQQSETVAAVEGTTANLLGTLTDRVWGDIRVVSASGCTGASGTAATAANGRLRIFTSTVVALPMPLIPRTTTKMGNTINTQFMQLTRWNGTNLDVLQPPCGSATAPCSGAALGVGNVGAYTSAAVDSVRHTINIDKSDVATGDTICIEMRGPVDQAPLGLEPR